MQWKRRRKSAVCGQEKVIGRGGEGGVGEGHGGDGGRASGGGVGRRRR